MEMNKLAHSISKLLKHYFKKCKKWFCDNIRQ